MSSASDISSLIESSDLDGLVIAVDALCAALDWDGLVSLEQRCRAALERGRQLWPVASHIHYRLALSAPASYAANVIVPGTGRFALGPLPEVAASTHTWTELAPWLSDDAGPLKAVCAHERVVRGEDLSGCAGIDPTVLELPLRLEAWEPAYPGASYEAHRAEFPMPVLPAPLEPVAPPGPTAVHSTRDPEGVRALLELAGEWTRGSDGRAEVAVVRGSALDALGGLGLLRARVAAISAADALSLMAWTGASGGAHGRRRGMAAGRFSAWWTVLALGGALDDWPVDATAVGEMARRLRWHRWDAGEPETGWACRLTVEDPGRGLAWALAATDA